MSLARAQSIQTLAVEEGVQPSSPFGTPVFETGGLSNVQFYRGGSGGVRSHMPLSSAPAFQTGEPPIAQHLHFILLSYFVRANTQNDKVQSLEALRGIEPKRLRLQRPRSYH